MKNKLKYVLAAVLLIAATGFLVMLLMKGEEVEVKKLTYQDIKDSFTEDGTVKSPEKRIVHPLTNATAEKVHVEEGDKIEKGEILLTLDSSELEFSRRELWANLRAIQGETKQLEEEPGEAKTENIKIAIEMAEERLNNLKDNYNNIKQVIHSELETLEINIEEAEEIKETVERNYERIKNLYENGIATKQELEEVEDQLQGAKHDLRRQEKTLDLRKKSAEQELIETRNMLDEAKYNLEKQKKALDVLEESYEPPAGSKEIIEANKDALYSQVNLINYKIDNYYEINAPISGRVKNLNVKEGEMATTQLPLMDIFQEDNYEIEVEVLTRDIHNIYEGMEVTLTQERREEDIVFSGEVISIAPYARESISALGLEEERVKVTVLPDCTKDLELAPGYQVEVEFVIQKEKEQLAVPNSALFSYEGEDALFVVENETALIKKVTTGLESDRKTVITNDLEKNDLIIVNPEQKNLFCGSRVNFNK